MKSDKPAFPCPLEAEEYGMTLRDYFAAKAMQAMISHGWEPENTPGTIARIAYQMAGAMITERSK